MNSDKFKFYLGIGFLYGGSLLMSFAILSSVLSFPYYMLIGILIGTVTNFLTGGFVYKSKKKVGKKK